MCSRTPHRVITYYLTRGILRSFHFCPCQRRTLNREWKIVGVCEFERITVKYHSLRLLLYVWQDGIAFWKSCDEQVQWMRETIGTRREKKETTPGVVNAHCPLHRRHRPLLNILMMKKTLFPSLTIFDFNLKISNATLALSKQIQVIFDLCEELREFFNFLCVYIAFSYHNIYASLLIFWYNYN